MKNPFVILIVLLSLTLHELLAQGMDDNIIDKTYYISSTEGDDRNDGLSEKKPKQHIYSVKEKENLHIKLKRNDVFFEQLQGYKNCIIDDYGKGGKPVLCGFKILINSQAWIYDENEELWKIDLTKEEDFVGHMHGDQKDKYINNVGFIYDPNTNKVYGNRVRERLYLKENGSFYVSNQYIVDSINDNTFKYLIWKLKDDPRNAKNLCFPMWLIGIKNMYDCNIRNIAIVGFNFGIVNCNGTTFDSCQIDLIGGSVQLGYNNWVRYGNGIEFTLNNNNNLITGCMISRTYDCGVSIQGVGSFKSSPCNIHFDNNKFYHCRQAFEFFLKSSNEIQPEYVNCSFSNNTCFEMGENEFSSPELRDANLLSYDPCGKSLTISGNTFFGASHFCGPYYPTNMYGNVIYIYEGQYISNYHFSRQNPAIFAKNRSDIESYRQQSGDNSSIVIMKQGSKYAKRMERKIRKLLAWEPVDLHLERLNSEK